MNTVCDEVLNLLSQHLVKDALEKVDAETKEGEEDNDKSQQAESAVFYLKMKGDYYRWIEFCGIKDNVLWQ